MAKERIANNSVPVLEDFKKWYIDQNQHKKNPSDTASNYCSWLKRIIGDIKKASPNIILVSSEEKFLWVIPALIKTELYYKAEIICDLLVAHINEAITLSKNNNKSDLNNDRSALRAYISYIKSIIKSGGFKTTLSVQVPDYDDLMPFRKELNHYPTNVAKGKFDKIDGIDALIQLFGNNENNHLDFIKKVLKESYFFSPDLEQKRFEELVEELDKVSYARYSQEEHEKYGCSKKQIISNSQNNPIKYTLKDGSGPFCVKLDNDGNRKLRQIINDKTNYWVSNGKDTSQFVNFRISHIWGRAFDPRYFTSLWNVVIVPAWANDLLEKDYGYSSLVNKMKDTFKAICINLYGMKDKNWDKIKLASMPELKQDSSEIPGAYEINVIKDKGNGTYGQIYTQIVTISKSVSSSSDR